MGTRKFICLCSLMWLLALAAARAQADPRVQAGGQEILFQNYLSQNGALYVAGSDGALLELARIFGAQLHFDPALNQISITGNGHVIFIFPSGLTIDGKSASESVPSLTQDKTWYLSLNTLAQALGANLTYDSDKSIWQLDPYVTGVALQAAPGEISFTMQATGTIVPTVTATDSPEGVVVEIPYASLAKNVGAPELMSQANPLVGTVTLAQEQASPATVRLTIPLLNSDVHWDAKQDADGRSFTLNITANIPLQDWVPHDQQIIKAEQPSQSSTPLQGATPETQAAQTPTGAPTNLEGITLAPLPGGGFVARLAVSGTTAYQWHQLKFPDDRLFIDFQNCSQKIAQPPSFSSPLLNEVRIAEFQKVPYPIARVVLALHDTYKVSILPDPSGIKIVVTNTTQNLSANLSGTGTSGKAPPVAQAAPRPFHPNGITVVIDPGHGGGDTGAIGTRLMEKQVTLDIALRLRALLTQQGFNVLMTRATDQECLGYEGSAPAELQCRADVANRNHAAFFVALHVNADDASWPHGIATYWYKTIDVPLAGTLQRYLGTETGFADRGIIRAPFYVLRHTAVPSVLVEMGFITNASDQALLAEEGVREKLVQALDQGIESYAGMRQQGRL